jgi:hypothetical protein
VLGEYVVPTVLACSRRQAARTARAQKLREFSAARRAAGEASVKVSDLVSEALGKATGGTANVSLAEMIRNVVEGENKSGNAANRFTNNVTYGQEAGVKKDPAAPAAEADNEEDAEERKKREEADLKAKREAELAALRAALEAELAKLRAIAAQQDDLATARGLHEELTPGLDKDNQDLTKQYKLKKQMLDMLPNADENMAKVRE